jgi:hypothetical protein
MKRFSDSTVVAGSVVMDTSELPQQVAGPAPAAPATTGGEIAEQLSETADVVLPPVVQEPVNALTPVTINIVFP